MDTKTYHLNSGNYDWAFITITRGINSDQAFLISIHSSYGSWAFIWNQPGEDYIKFLETADKYYTFNKLSNTKKLSINWKYRDSVERKEWTEYENFYEKFWPKLIEALKKGVQK